MFHRKLIDIELRYSKNCHRKHSKSLQTLCKLQNNSIYVDLACDRNIYPQTSRLCNDILDPY